VIIDFSPKAALPDPFYKEERKEGMRMMLGLCRTGFPRSPPAFSPEAGAVNNFAGKATKPERPTEVLSKSMT
jgi:hypothetical protein